MGRPKGERLALLYVRAHILVIGPNQLDGEPTRREPLLRLQLAIHLSQLKCDLTLVVLLDGVGRHEHT